MLQCALKFGPTALISIPHALVLFECIFFLFKNLESLHVFEVEDAVIVGVTGVDGQDDPLAELDGEGDVDFPRKA